MNNKHKMGKVYYIMAVFAAIFFTACQEDDFRGDTQGGIRITLAEEVGVDVTTRSTPEELTKLQMIRYTMVNIRQKLYLLVQEHIQSLQNMARMSFWMPTNLIIKE